MGPFVTDGRFFSGEFSMDLHFRVPWRDTDFPPYATYISMNARIRVNIGVQSDTVEAAYVPGENQMWMLYVDHADNNEHPEHMLTFPHADFPDVTFEPNRRTLRSLLALRPELLAGYQPRDHVVVVEPALYTRVKDLLVADLASRMHYLTQGLGFTWLVDPNRVWPAGSVGGQSAEKLAAAFVPFDTDPTYG